MHAPRPLKYIVAAPQENADMEGAELLAANLHMRLVKVVSITEDDGEIAPQSRIYITNPKYQRAVTCARQFVETKLRQWNFEVLHKERSPKYIHQRTHVRDRNFLNRDRVLPFSRE